MRAGLLCHYMGSWAQIPQLFSGGQKEGRSHDLKGNRSSRLQLITGPRHRRGEPGRDRSHGPIAFEGSREVAPKWGKAGS
jgi:hypothetical protein